ncbi:hypothetical protein CLU79DRAFT_832951 [Phycomyces nitens]|nr:hypothetical protein CLU79DRAFT_832951 [Phycomyces nitens]
MLKDYDKEEDSQTTAKAEPYNMLLLNNSSVQRYEKEKDNNAKASESYKLRSRTIRLRDRLVNDQKAEHKNIGKDENSAYLAAFLHVLGPEKAKKRKHCILNGSLTIGLRNEDTFLWRDYICLSDEVTITGPGAICKYQKEIKPWDVRYLSTNMIDNPESAHNMDETSYIEIFVTLGQLFFTTISCMDIDGDRWAKVVIII